MVITPTIKATPTTDTRSMDQGDRCESHAHYETTPTHGHLILHLPRPLIPGHSAHSQMPHPNVDAPPIQ